MVDKEYGRSTYVCDLSHIPVAAARFDAVALNQVLEHLSDPVAVLCEMHRILKNGGTMICSAPLFYEEHEQPYDFFRYTQFAWRHLLRNAGFDIVSLDWMEGYLGTVAYQMETASKHLSARREELRSRCAGSCGRSAPGICTNCLGIWRGYFIASTHGKNTPSLVFRKTTSSWQKSRLPLCKRLRERFNFLSRY